MSFVRCLGLASLSSLTAAAAHAADLAPAPAPEPTGYIVSIGLGPQVIPSFPGARTYRVWPTGTFAWRRPGDPPPFTAPDDGFGIALLDTPVLKAGPVARFLPRRGLSNGNGNFYGLANVGWTFEIGGFGEVWLAPFLRTRVELRQGVNGHKGLDANAAIDAVIRADPFTFSVGPRFALGNSTFMNAYFSVTPAEAAANGNVTPFQATGGVTSFGGLAAVKYDFSKSLSATVYGGYDRLVNSAAASPITNRLGSKNQWSGGVVFAYSFHFAGF